MDYTDIGYNDFLLRPLEASFTDDVGVDSNVLYLQKGDKITSLNKNMVMDLENDSFVVKEGDINRVEIGKLSDGTIGMVIRDNQGNTLLNVTPESNKITSANGHLELDFVEERIIVYDEGRTPRILLGKQTGGF